MGTRITTLTTWYPQLITTITSKLHFEKSLSSFSLCTNTFNIRSQALANEMSDQKDMSVTSDHTTEGTHQIDTCHTRCTLLLGGVSTRVVDQWLPLQGHYGTLCLWCVVATGCLAQCVCTSHCKIRMYPPVATSDAQLVFGGNLHGVQAG
jgi:hypothetical protein